MTWLKVISLPIVTLPLEIVMAVLFDDASIKLRATLGKSSVPEDVVSLSA